MQEQNRYFSSGDYYLIPFQKYKNDIYISSFQPGVEYGGLWKKMKYSLEKVELLVKRQKDILNQMYLTLLVFKDMKKQVFRMVLLVVIG